MDLEIGDTVDRGVPGKGFGLHRREGLQTRPKMPRFVLRRMWLDIPRYTCAHGNKRQRPRVIPIPAMDTCPQQVLLARFRLVTFLVGSLIRGALVLNLIRSTHHPITVEQTPVFFWASTIVFWVLPAVESPCRWLSMLCSVLISVLGHLHARNRRFVMWAWVLIYVELLDVIRDKAWLAAVFSAVVSELVLTV